MTPMVNDSNTNETQHVEEVLRTPEAQRLVTEIRSQLPGLAALNGAFAKLHALLDDGDLAENFEACCHRRFGVNPEMLRDAADRS